jgi:hypothetical protein
MANNISYDFINFPPKDLGVFAQNITEQMPQYPIFDGFKEEVALLKSAYTPFWAAYLAALKGGSDRIAERNALQDELLLQLQVVAYLVESKAVRNPSVVADSGYKQRSKTKSSAPEVQVPTNIEGTNLKRLGAFELGWKGSEGSISYTIETRIKGETAWGNRKNTTRQNIVLEGFPSGVYVELRICANGSGTSTSDWSDIITVLVS